jgi:hypothetical protein
MRRLKSGRATVAASGPAWLKSGVEYRPAKAALVSEGKPGAVLELDGEAIPARLLIALLENDPASQSPASCRGGPVINCYAM